MKKFGMKTTLFLTAALVAALPSALLADEPSKGCSMMKPSADSGGCCCCCKMKSQTAAAQPTVDELLAKAKEAKGDDLLDALSAVIKKLIEERKAPASSSAPDTAPQGHQH